MKRLTTVLLMVCFILGVFTPILSFADDLSDAEIQRIKDILVIDVIENPENPKKPMFKWPAIDEAESYALYVRNEIIYSGALPVFPPDESYAYEEFAYGYYQAYLLVTLRNGQRIRTEPIAFVIGITKPDLLTLKEQMVTYKLKPQFRWTSVRGATGYEVFLDNNPVYDGEGTSWEPEEPMEMGRHSWNVVAKNEFQRTRSDRGAFEIIPIEPPVLISPENGYAVTVISEADIPTLTWRKVEPKAEGEITYELYVNGQMVYNGSDTRWRSPKLLEPGLYEWYAKAKVWDQISDPSETWQFTLREKLGMNLGVKAGGNLSRNTNQNSRLRPMFSAGVYADQKIFRRKSFELRGELNTLVEMKSVGFNQEDNSIRQVEDLHITTFNITIPLMIKPMYTISGITIYALLGPQFSASILSRIIRDDLNYKETLVDQINRFALDLVAAVGVSYTFDVNYLFGQKLQLSAEFRFNYGFFESLHSSFLGDKGNLTQFSILIGNKIIDF